METTSAILWALANTDSGTLTVPLDPSIYTEDVVRTFVDRCASCSAQVDNTSEGPLLTMTASDSAAARLQIANALTDLLQLALRCRQ